jgi:hypothetical protein
MKKRKFSIQRHAVETADAQRRWDQAYQCLVRWSAPSLRGPPQEDIQQERRENESRDVCPSLYTTAGANANH